MHGKSLQAAFFRRLAGSQAILGIFDFLPEVYFFVKNREGLIMAASAAILARLGLEREEQFIGLTDYDVFPKELADAYAADDAEVFRTGRPLLNRLELWLDESGRPDWCVTTKVPLRDRGGAIVGLTGITRREAGRGALQPTSDATRAVNYLRENVARVRTTAELALGVGVSERSLNRKINEAFGVSPYELVLRIRVKLAAEALQNTTDSIASIAQSHGFCDQSAFTQHFRKRMGVAPGQFRRQRPNASRASRGG